MQTHTREIGAARVGTVALIAALTAVVAIPLTDADAGPKASKIWRKVAGKLRSSAKAEAKADYQLALARAEALLDEDERDEAIEDAKDDFKDDKATASDAYKARLALAIKLGEDELYTVDVDPANFVAVIDNPYLPYIPGTVMTYQGETEDGLETIVVTVLEETKEILGVTCTVVQDTVSIDGVTVEDTLDWYAQDTSGNVWYFGEISFEYEDGEIVGTEGSWLSGRDGALPGIVMLANPEVDDCYRQEFYLGEAEDWGQVLATDATATVPFGVFNNCVQTLDALPTEPDVIEHKFYAPGLGFVRETKPETGEVVELISVVNPGE